MTESWAYGNYEEKCMRILDKAEKQALAAKDYNALIKIADVGAKLHQAKCIDNVAIEIKNLHDTLEGLNYSDESSLNNIAKAIEKITLTNFVD